MPISAAVQALNPKPKDPRVSSLGVSGLGSRAFRALAISVGLRLEGLSFRFRVSIWLQV